jgi:2,4-dienoyl-CoA reductase-like NADH-dependent reductase (Old Yellow Enzyme family)
MDMAFAKPHALTQDEIDRIKDGFAHATEYFERTS